MYTHTKKTYTYIYIYIYVYDEYIVRILSAASVVLGRTSASPGLPARM